MAITRLDHVSVLAGDAGPTVDFYCEKLGFVLRRRRELPDRGMTIIDLDGHGSHMEVIVPAGGLGKGAGGLKHVAFRSDDIEADMRSMEAAGVAVLPPGLRHMEGARLFFVASPSGEYIEFIQYDE